MSIYACGIPIRNGKLLLGRRADHRKLYPRCWDVIGGKVEAGETIEMALIRELREELGVTPTRWTYVGPVQDSPTSPKVVLTYEMFAVYKWTGGEPSIRNSEHTELRWFDVEDACALSGLACSSYADVFRKIGTHAANS